MSIGESRTFAEYCPWFIEITLSYVPQQRVKLVIVISRVYACEYLLHFRLQNFHLYVYCNYSECVVNRGRLKLNVSNYEFILWLVYNWNRKFLKCSIPWKRKMKLNVKRLSRKENNKNVTLLALDSTLKELKGFSLLFFKVRSSRVISTGVYIVTPGM